MQSRRRDLDFVVGATEARLHRSAPVGRQFERRWRAAEPSRPVGQFARAHAAGQPAGFPMGVVGITQCQRRQPGRAAAPACRVQLAQFTQQQVDRPAVADAVMQGPQQAVVSHSELDQRGAHRHLACGIDGAHGFDARHPLEFALCVGTVAATQVDARHGPFARGPHVLHQLAFDADPTTTQDIVALLQLAQACGEQVAVQRASQREHKRYVVERDARRHFLPEGHALLGRRKRTRCFALLTAQRHNGRRCRRRSCRNARQRGIDQRHHGAQARLAEHAGGRQRHAEARLDRLQQAERGQRVQPAFNQ